ncbi:MAG: tRNA (adenosine(37)-N6)-dimethylallyltransferase MiaA [Clostridiaceae bacterium]|nr:tRNA (adenosine(37)-N6)-dimethylallyltransferase MiaA [Clostridiaceae bacterium]
MKVVVVCGPTASGKTALAVELAKRFDGEVISADSMQVYRELNIGTAKPSEQEQRGIPHHMVDIVSVTESYSVSRYEGEAALCVDDIILRGKLPIVCGGTGLYIKALINGSGFAENDSSGKLRSHLESLWDNEGADAVMARLKEADPESAERLHINDRNRIIRALEVYLLTGKTISAHNLETQKRLPRYESCFIGICPYERPELYRRIDVRVDQMMSNGLLDEVTELSKKGLMINTAAQAIGYKELFGYLNNEMSLEESVAVIKQKSRNYAKRQLTWFNRDDRINWIKYEKNGNFGAAVSKATNFLADSGVIL